MSEETLNRLFEQARNEAPETKLSDIQKWIGLGALSILAAGLLTKLKLIITLKPFIMISSLIVAAGVGTGAVLLLNVSEPEMPKTPEIVAFTAPTPKKPAAPTNEIALAPIKAEPIVQPAEPVPPLNPMLMEWNAEETPYPDENYCSSLPIVAPKLPMKSVRPVQLYKITDDGKDYGTFNALKISGAVDVVLIQGSKSGVRLEGDEKGIESAVIKNNSQTLEIYTDCKGRGNDCNFKLTVYVTFESLGKITCTGASTIESQGELKLDDLDMIISGASEIALDLSVTELKIDASGASEIVLNGKAEKLKLMNSGATDFKADGFEVKSAKVDCSGASEASLNVSEHLDIAVSGASEVEYTGDAVIGNKSITGASEFKHK